MGANGYTLEEAADIMGCVKMTVWRKIKKGQIVAFKDEGRYGPTWRIPELPGEFAGRVVTSSMTKAEKKGKAKPVSTTEIKATLDEIQQTQQAMLSRLGQLEGGQPHSAPSMAVTKPKKRRPVKDKGERYDFAQKLIRGNPKIKYDDCRTQLTAKFGKGITTGVFYKLRREAEAK